MIETQSSNANKLACTLLKLEKTSTFRAISSSLGAVSKISTYLDAVKHNITTNMDFLAELVEHRKTIMTEKTEN